MKRVTALTLMIFAAGSHVLPALEKDKAAYAGGTIAMLNATDGPIQGRIDTSDPERLIFVADEHTLADIPLRVEYAAIHHVEFGQKGSVTSRCGASSIAASWDGRCCIRSTPISSRSRR